MNKQFFSFLLFMLPFAGFAQVGVGTNNVHPSAKFQIESNNKGFLQPRIALTGTNDVSTIANPATGLTVYNTATAGSGATAITPGVHYFDGTRWVRMESSVINAGTGTTVTGTGTTTNPYVINSTAGGGSSPAVFVAGEFLTPFLTAQGANSRRSFVSPVNSENVYPAIKMGFITLNPGKWEVHLNNYCEISILRFFGSGATISMMYWLQNDSTTLTLGVRGVVTSAATPFGSSTYNRPPLDGGDTLFANSANFISRIDFSSNPIHKGSFFINNASGQAKTYYLFASEIATFANATANALMPQYIDFTANKFIPFNRFYATKIE